MHRDSTRALCARDVGNKKQPAYKLGQVFAKPSKEAPCKEEEPCLKKQQDEKDGEEEEEEHDEMENGKSWQASRNLQFLRMQSPDLAYLASGVSTGSMLESGTGRSVKTHP